MHDLHANPSAALRCCRRQVRSRSGVPPGYELVKEEDKNILMGDTYTAPVTTQFAGLGNIFIMPDQARSPPAYNPNNSLNPTTDLGVTPRHEGDTGSVETFWPCVGRLASFLTSSACSRRQDRTRPSPVPLATCAIAKKWCWKTRCRCWRSSTSSARPTSPATSRASSRTTSLRNSIRSRRHFGEKFSPPNLPVRIKDLGWQRNFPRLLRPVGNLQRLELTRRSAVNPPDPSGYVPHDDGRRA